jgi:hypothetical protein
MTRFSPALYAECTRLASVSVHVHPPTRVPPLEMSMVDRRSISAQWFREYHRLRGDST